MRLLSRHSPFSGNLNSLSFTKISLSLSENQAEFISALPVRTIGQTLIIKKHAYKKRQDRSSLRLKDSGGVVPAIFSVPFHLTFADVALKMLAMYFNIRHTSAQSDVDVRWVPQDQSRLYRSMPLRTIRPLQVHPPASSQD